MKNKPERFIRKFDYRLLMTKFIEQTRFFLWFRVVLSDDRNLDSTKVHHVTVNVREHGPAFRAFQLYSFSIKH